MLRRVTGSRFAGSRFAASCTVSVGVQEMQQMAAQLEQARGREAAAQQRAWEAERAAGTAVGEAVVLLHPPLPSVGVSVWMERGCQRSDGTLAGG